MSERETRFKFTASLWDTRDHKVQRWLDASPWWRQLLLALVSWGVPIGLVWRFGLVRVIGMSIALSIPGYAVVFLAVGHRLRPPASGVTRLMAVTTAAMWLWLFLDLDAAWWVKMLMLPIPLFLMTITNWLRVGVDWRAQQPRRNERATEIALSVLQERNAEHLRFALYLRPFESTGELATQARSFANSANLHYDFEAVLSDALGDECPVVALGGPDDLIGGVGRVGATDDNWEEVVASLANAASLIVIVPLAYDGTMWEVEYAVRHRLLDKTVFLMPEGIVQLARDVSPPSAGPSRVFPFVHFGLIKGGYDWEGEWENARAQAWKRVGAWLPWYAHPGSLFVLENDDLEHPGAAHLALTTVVHKAAYVRAVLAVLDRTPWHPTRVELDAAFTSALPRHPLNVEVGLIAAAYAYLVWGGTEIAIHYVQLAAEAGAVGTYMSEFAEGRLIEGLEALESGEPSAVPSLEVAVAAYEAVADDVSRVRAVRALDVAKSQEQG